MKLLPFKQRGFTLLEISLVLALGFAAIFGGISIFQKVIKENEIRDRISTVTIVTNEFSIGAQYRSMASGSYQGRIRNGIFPLLHPNLLPPLTQVILEREGETHIVYYNFQDRNETNCLSLRVGLTTRNDRHYAGYSPVLNRWISVVCNFGENGIVSTGLRIPMNNAEQWVLNKGFIP